MKRISTLLLGAALALVATTSMAVTTTVTALDTGWTCTTNASSSSVTTDVAADKEMSETSKSAADAFAFAAKNCRDCTKITCSVSE